MKMKILPLLASIAIFSTSFSAKAQYPVLDISALQKMLEGLSYTQEQLTEINRIKSLMDQQNALLGAIEAGRFDSSLSILKRMNKQLGDYSVPFLNSEILQAGVSADFSSHEAGLKTINNLFYLDRNSGSGIDNRNKIFNLRRKAYNESVARSYSLSQEYKENLPELLDQYNTALQELNNSTSIAETEQAQAKIQAASFMLNMWRTNLEASRTNVDSMKQILGDERIYRDELE